MFEKTLEKFSKNGVRWQRLRASQRVQLKKKDLLVAIAEVRAAEFTKRLDRAEKTNQFSAIRGDVDNPQQQSHRGREVANIKDEVDAALNARQYTTE